jgi:hypothetical protein
MMTAHPATPLALLTECHLDKLTMRQRHAAVARQVSHYEFNNAYQYVIAREDVHVAWLEAAITELGGTPQDVAEPVLPSKGKGNAFLALVAEDARGAEAFAARWRTRLAEVGNARHRTMLQLMCGETIEQKRFFDQIVAGREDLLGRRANGPKSDGTGDGVMAVRWVE